MCADLSNRAKVFLLSRPMKEGALALFAAAGSAMLALGISTLMPSWWPWPFLAIGGIVILAVAGGCLLLGKHRSYDIPLLDLRFWAALALALPGQHLLIFSGTRPKWMVLACMWPWIIAIVVLMVQTILLSTRLQKAVVTTARRQGWRLSRRDEKDVPWESLLMEEMTRGERLRHRLVMALSIFTFFGSLYGLSRYEAWFLVVTFSIAYMTLLLYLNYLARHQLVQRKRSEYELDAARQMQMSLMPEHAPDVRGLEVAGATIPAQEVGGDLFHYYVPPGEGEALGVVLADVSGKGMKAAVATVLVSGMLRAERGRGASPGAMLGAVNEALVGEGAMSGFVATQAMVLSPSKRQALYCNAGQVHPLLRRGGAVTWLTESELPLGIAREVVYSDVTLALEPGDLLVFLSDGIVEAMNGERELFGFGRLEAAVLALGQGLPAREVIEAILDQVRAFVGKTDQHDDMTLVAVKVLG